MHKIQQLFCERLKAKFPDYFTGKRVLDIGSLDINGNNKYLFDDCEYIGLDIVEGKNVDVVCIAHEYENSPFDVVISTNSLEHDIYHAKTLLRMTELLKPNGLMIMSCASRWATHGTLKEDAEFSGTSQMGKEWANYYQNLRPYLILKVFDPQKYFYRYEIGLEDRDTQFWGIKK